VGPTFVGQALKEMVYGHIFLLMLGLRGSETVACNIKLFTVVINGVVM
jgi:hypothetical protein